MGGRGGLGLEKKKKAADWLDPTRGGVKFLSNALITSQGDNFPGKPIQGLFNMATSNNAHRIFNVQYTLKVLKTLFRIFRV